MAPKCFFKYFIPTLYFNIYALSREKEIRKKCYKLLQKYSACAKIITCEKVKQVYNLTRIRTNFVYAKKGLHKCEILATKGRDLHAIRHILQCRRYSAYRRFFS